MEVIVIDQRSFKEKVSDAYFHGKQAVKKRASQFCSFYCRNYKYTIPITIYGIHATSSLIGRINRHAQIREEEIRRTQSFYERREGLNCYYTTKRPVTALELEEIERRRINGELYGNILRDMGLLK